MSNGLIIWLAGRPGAEQLNLAYDAADALLAEGRRVEVLADEEMSQLLLEQPPQKPEEHGRHALRMAAVAGLLARHGVNVFIASTCPLNQARQAAEAMLGSMIEVHVRGGEAESDFETPVKPALTLNPDDDFEAARDKLIQMLGDIGLGSDQTGDAEDIKTKLADLGYM